MENVTALDGSIVWKVQSFIIRFKAMMHYKNNNYGRTKLVEFFKLKYIFKFFIRLNHG